MSLYDIGRYKSYNYNDAVKRFSKEANSLGKEAYGALHGCEWNDDVGKPIKESLALAIKIAENALSDCEKSLKSVNVSYDIDNMSTDFSNVNSVNPLML